MCVGTRVSLLHTRACYPLLYIYPPPPRSWLHRFCTNTPAIVVYRSFRFFPPSFRAFPGAPTYHCVLFFLLFAASSPFKSFFFYFPTIIIPSNFAHSKRWRKFVEVTPRENAEDSVQNKGPWGWLSLFPTRRKRGALPTRKRRRGGLKRILLVKCRARRSR